VVPDCEKQQIALIPVTSAISRAAETIASAEVSLVPPRLAWVTDHQVESLSTSNATAFMVFTASMGYWPAADSADSITASAPS